MFSINFWINRQASHNNRPKRIKLLKFDTKDCRAMYAIFTIVCGREFIAVKQLPINVKENTKI